MAAAKVIALIVLGIAAVAYLLHVISARNKRLRLQDALRHAGRALIKATEHQKSVQHLANRIAEHRKNDSEFCAFYESQTRLRDINILSSPPSQEMCDAMNAIKDRYPHTSARKHRAAMNICLQNIEEWLDTHYPEEKEERWDTA